MTDITIDKLTVLNNTAYTSIINGFIDIQNTNTKSYVQITNVTAKGNSVNTEITSSNLYVFSVTNINKLLISDVTFYNNIGTPIVLRSDKKSLGKLHLYLSGILLFGQNSGLFGGACALYNLDVIANIRGETVGDFKGNSAVYGGAVYIQTYSIIVVSHMQTFFENNTAVTAGNSIYFATNPNTTVEKNKHLFKFNNSTNNIRSLATSISFIAIGNTTNFNLFPGQTIIVNFSIMDFFGFPSSCTADVYLKCNNRLHSCLNEPVRMKGPETVVIAQNPNTNVTTVDTGLIVLSPEGPDVNNNISLLLWCQNLERTGTEIPLKITKCPLGFIYSQDDSMCKCAEVLKNTTFVCSAKFGTACVLHGHWYGTDFNNTFIARCSFPECRYSYEPCPSDLLTAGSTHDYVLLGFDADRQCSDGRGGALCRGCALGYVFTFTSAMCVPQASCSWWQPYLILLFSILFQILIALLLVLVVRFKYILGSGFLYGPMLFLALVNHLPLHNYLEYSTLSTAISVITSIPLLNLELFSLIPWCFFPSFSKLYNYSLHYLGPLTVLTVILIISFIARQWPNVLRRWQSSPLKAMCILMLLSFWSLADISVNILTLTVISYKRENSIQSTYVVSVQPEFKYFSPEHLPVAIPALLVLIAVITPLLIILLLSPLLSKIVSLHRIKPFLDEFQSCYKDKYRWYSAVYFTVWIFIVTLQGHSAVLFIQTAFIILTSVHFLIRPYRSRVLNTMDMLLLLDLNFLIALLHHKLEKSLTAMILVYILVLGPLPCFLVLFAYACILKCGVYKYAHGLWTRRRQHSTDRQQHDEEQEQQHAPVPVYIFEDREPLIGIVNDA